MTRTLLTGLIILGLMIPVAAAAEHSFDEAEYQEYLRQQEGERKAEAIHDTIVPIVRELFTRNRNETVIIYHGPYGPYGPYWNPHNVHNVPNKKGPNKCMQKVNNGPWKSVPCY